MSVRSIKLTNESDDDIFDEKECMDERVAAISQTSAINRLKRFPSPTVNMISKNNKGINYYLDQMENLSMSDSSFNSEISKIPLSTYRSNSQNRFM